MSKQPCTKSPKRAQHAPHTWKAPNYGAKQQLTTLEDTSKPLTPEEIKRVQQVTGTLLYYARAVKATLPVALGTIAAQQAPGTATTQVAITQILDYCHTHPSATIRYRASNIVLKIHSNASCLSKIKASSRPGGHFYMGDKPSNQPEQGNGPILNKSTIKRKFLCLRQLRQNVEHTTITPKREFCYVIHSTKWDIHNHPPLSKWTTQQPMDSPISKSSNRNPNQWI